MDINWPIPPINDDDINGSTFIPENLSIFGVNYVHKNGILQMNEEFSEINYKEIQDLVAQSYSSFKQLLLNFNPILLDSFVETHNSINEKLNKGKVFEKDAAFNKAKRAQYNRIKHIIDEINNLK